MLIFGVNGACNGSELIKITVDNIKKHSDQLLLVTLEDDPTHRSFVIRDQHVKTVEKYMDLRPPDINTNRFFVNYQKGRCTKQVVGKNKLSHIPGQIASFLKLPNPEQYTGNCFRRTSKALGFSFRPILA